MDKLYVCLSVKDDGYFVHKSDDKCAVEILRKITELIKYGQRSVTISNKILLKKKKRKN